MFKGYKLSSVHFKDNSDFFKNIGQELFGNYENRIKRNLKSFLFCDNSLDGSKIIESWFPRVEADIFISHSHRDESHVLELSGWLYNKFGIKSFIDSCIWGYGNELIQILDDEYSWLDEENRIYNYRKVIDSASHVHMMLSTALNAMIDKTECLIFYDTPNSIESFENSDKTNSPWIYSEIAFSQIVRRRLPVRVQHLITESRYFSDGVDHFEKALKVKYDVDSSHLVEINADTLNAWARYSPFEDAVDALDFLYELTYPIKRTNNRIHG
jgi:hypothetical protein